MNSAERELFKRNEETIDHLTGQFQILDKECRFERAGRLLLVDSVERLERELTESRAKNAEYEDSFKSVMCEVCAENDDRQHCPCVPDLRKALKEARAAHESALRMLVVVDNAYSGGLVAHAFGAGFTTEDSETIAELRAMLQAGRELPEPK